MDYTIASHPQANAFVVTIRSPFDVRCLASLADDLLAHADWQPGRHCLFDYRASDFSAVQAAELRWAADLHAERRERIGRGRFALVMRDLLDFGIGRMYELNVADRVETEIHVFRDFAEARRWIGLDPA